VRNYPERAKSAAGVTLSEQDRARLRTFCLGFVSVDTAGRALGSSGFTVGKLLDGFGAKASSVETILARLPA
jgi:hypothetical protein